MTKIDIFSGFLGAGKTTLIKKLIKEAYNKEKVVLIENEFGEIGIDGGFLEDAGIEITEMNSGCICCSLVGDFSKALEKVLTEYAPDRVIIEPSGVGKLSDVIKAVRGVETENARLNCFTTVVDAGKCKMYMKNFGEFFNDQIENASSIIFSHTDKTKPEKLAEALELVRAHNANAVLVVTPWNEISGESILSAMEEGDTIEKSLHEMVEHHHHHHDDDDDEHDHEHHHHHDDDDDEHDHEHHHHHDDDDDEHDHHHEHGEECSCGCHGHHHHHADEVFASVGVETSKKFTEDEIRGVLEELDEGECGMVIRAKGIVPTTDGRWIHFDYVPGEIDIRYGNASIIGRLCVIGSEIDKEKIKELLGV